MKKLLIILFAAAAGVITLAQLNFEQALEKASKLETDGEIQQVMQEHGFQCDPFQRIGMSDKIEAVFFLMKDHK